MLKIVGKILQFFGFFGFAFCLILGIWALNYDIILGLFFIYSSFVSLGLGIGAWIVVVKEELREKGLHENVAQLPMMPNPPEISYDSSSESLYQTSHRFKIDSWKEEKPKEESKAKDQ